MLSAGVHQALGLAGPKNPGQDLKGPKEAWLKEKNERDLENGHADLT